ncbi:MAG: Asp-tRNA(Asn)/Glu-tRNA(Gln) amidotransferase subunit GatC [Candidatus Adiutrix sp.]|jgi:aspartyl-tRNA(Asn)/glutamyl-tRNA(Gln) amidotransferase subunit C|nr:Asp-tRNA(Asn)/Glu-tRNA(Gln) amidotransferase subunit GatC [Candidatus Adiutrix sp.]
MPIDLKTVRHTAELARLDPGHGLSPDEAEAALAKLADELAGIVAHIDILSEAETSGVEPLYSPLIEAPAPREDRPADCAHIEEILRAAPDRVGNFYVVPKII